MDGVPNGTTILISQDALAWKIWTRTIINKLKTSPIKKKSLRKKHFLVVFMMFPRYSVNLVIGTASGSRIRSTCNSQFENLDTFCCRWIAEVLMPSVVALPFPIVVSCFRPPSLSLSPFSVSTYPRLYSNFNGCRCRCLRHPPSFVPSVASLACRFSSRLYSSIP